MKDEDYNKLQLEYQENSKKLTKIREYEKLKLDIQELDEQIEAIERLNMEIILDWDQEQVSFPACDHPDLYKAIKEYLWSYRAKKIMEKEKL
jgi:hypothetical protein